VSGRNGADGMGTVIFDLDGTLADTSGDLLAAANACFRSMGEGDLLGPEDAPVALNGGRAMLRLGMERLGRAGDEAEVDRLYPVLLEHYEEAIDHHTLVFPGAMEAIRLLSDGGYRMGICTNKPERLAQLLLTRLGVRDAFGSLVGADTLKVKKPDPEPLREAIRRAGGDPMRACLIGDSRTDRETARAAGLPSVLVSFGPSGPLTAALEPEALFAHFDELPDIVRRVVPLA
jgi:phosphoglycolate phosphatase